MNTNINVNAASVDGQNSENVNSISFSIRIAFLNQNAVKIT